MAPASMAGISVIENEETTPVINERTAVMPMEVYRLSFSPYTPDPGAHAFALRTLAIVNYINRLHTQHVTESPI